MTSRAQSTTDNDLDIRIALVLYGGVSLAIYENGVTRCFYDLVKQEGIFKILLDLLGATAQVDVIAGTSAGGINGLLLAATLESGADFAASEQLWRDLGDFGDLLRNPGDAKSAASLLKGETDFQDKLIAAFQRFCVRVDGYEYPNEIDVFVTGTDLDGQERLSWDALGNQISDKEHRIVFHLQHRPERKALGCVGREHETPDPDEQGAILGTIARITSSFPAAFPPFQLAHLQKMHAPHMPAVERALRRVALAGLEDADKRCFADGGLLDNKPFGPVLHAIFHRMPTGPAQRRLFYVEPDPEPRPDAPNPQKYTPLAVAGASATIGSHETIWNDLKDLDRHNARIRWFGQLKDTWIEQIARPELKPLLESALTLHGGALSVTYWKTRTESLTRSLFSGSDTSTASAEDEIKDPEHKELALAFSRMLDEWTKAVEQAATTSDSQLPVSAGPLLNAFDPDFHLRRSFHVLYVLYRKVREASNQGIDDRQSRSAMRFIGRLIKAQKMIRDLMVDLRREALVLSREFATDPMIPHEERAGRRARLIVNLYRIFLDAKAPHWAPLIPYCKLESDEIWALSDDWKRFFASDSISAAVKPARNLARNPRLLITEELRRMGQRVDVENEDLSVRWSILDELARVARPILAPCHTSLHDVMDQFVYLDVISYPLEFTAGMYELDEIKYVRISPQDAQIGLSRGKARSKVAGDDLFHFAALLRKDWRSNDILRGRLDGICQIIQALFAPTEENVRQLKRRWAQMSPLFDASLFASSEAAPHGLKCVKASWEALCKRWGDLGEVMSQPDPLRAPKLHAAWTAFCNALIRVGQDDAFLRSFESILQDHYCQEAAFGERPKEDARDQAGSAPTGPPKPTSAPILLKEAADFSERFLARLPREQQWSAFEKMKLGDQQISGREAAVPPHISGEYMTQGYLLLWGMVRSSLGETGQGILDRRSVRLMLRHPVSFLNTIFFLMRRSFSVALATIATTTGFLVGLAASIYFFGLAAISVFSGAVVALLFFMMIIAALVPRNQNRPLTRALLPAAGFAVVVSVAVVVSNLDSISALRNSQGLKGFAGGAVVASALTWLLMKIRSWRRGRRKRVTRADTSTAIQALAAE